MKNGPHDLFFIFLYLFFIKNLLTYKYFINFARTFRRREVNKNRHCYVEYYSLWRTGFR